MKTGDWIIIKDKYSSDYGTYVYIIEQVGSNKKGPLYDCINFFNTKDRKYMKKTGVMFYSVGFTKDQGWQPYSPKERDYQLAVIAAMEAE